ncbi:MAG TPA: hypothetical protein VK425_12645 [Acidimicrobiales bacterium]|nr:hypothetical protein [Acidimicrobiales bacterium]
MSTGLLVAVVVLAVAVLVVLLNFVVRRMGYSIPGRTIVRCRKGHLFRTTWIEGGSLKAVRLGPLTRYQYCPKGRHWAIVHPVKDEDLSDEERRSLAAEAQS